ncbi:hypothetical protein BCE02nite_52600 [Brevibacillus centrosporus]|nr:hypothetical protein BCE02nite_52600 [Brevibacillus centrosporus]
MKVTIETTAMSVLLLILIFYIRRGYLLRGIPEITSLQNLPSDNVVIDARDYNVSYKSPLGRSIYRMPICKGIYMK